MSFNPENFIINESQYERSVKLESQLQKLEVFRHENRIYLGSKVGAVLAFIQNNPEPADFSVWLQNTHIELNQSK